MRLSDSEHNHVQEYRQWMEAALAGDERIGPPQRFDRDDAATLATRFEIAESVWAELAVRPFVPQLQASIVTDDRWISEEFEQGIQDAGETMPEFVELGFEDAGLDWEEPPVLHYREAGKLFYFSTPLDIESVASLSDEALRIKTRQMMQGYVCAFGSLLSKSE